MSATGHKFVIPIAVLAMAACSDDPPPAKPKESAAPPPVMALGAKSPSARMSTNAKPLATYPKVPSDLRRELTKADFIPDATGDVNRDPFRSYLVEATGVAGSARSKEHARAEDECDKRTVAGQYGLRDLTLAGIVLRGTKSYALFIDQQRLGHIAHRGDCLSKDKARLREIGENSVVLELRAEAPPGAPAPPPREEVWRLHPDELRLSEDGSGFGGGQ
ncbi:MAG: hypothetical protein HY698_08815 [Deltaproteobacteria bacterium]|nr:hypothetical protein [Deltaproteobacteria bacterium]